MSQQGLDEFRKVVENDSGLREQLEAADSKRTFVDTAVRLASEHGHDVDESDVVSYLDSTSELREHSLSDEELQSAGGRPESYTYSKPGCQSH